MRRFVTYLLLLAAVLTLAGATLQGYPSSPIFAGIIKAGSTPTTLTDSAGKILSAALNTVGVGQGGTGLTSGTSGGVLGYTASGTLASSTALTANQLVVGGGAGATPAPLGALGTTTTLLHGNAAGNPSWSAVDLTADVTNALPAANGGTGQSSYAVGDVLYASGATALSKLADVAAGSYLRSGGVTTAPVWSTTTLPNSATTGDLLYASGSNTYANLAAPAEGLLLTGKGTSTAPAWVDPIVPADFVFIEEFPTAATGGSGGTGTLGWSVRTIGGAPSITGQSAVANHFGIARLTTTASTGQGGYMGLDNNSAAVLTNINTLPGTLDAYMVLALTQTTTTRMRVGLLTPSATTVQAADGVFIRYDTNAGFADTNFMLCRRASSDTEACVSTGTAANTSYHTFHVYTTTSSPTTINATVDGGSVVCMTTAGSGCGLNSTTFPTAGLSPGNIVVTDTNGAISVDFDYWSMRARGLSR
jgi:hypothetical protein